ncbi:MAG: short-chain dehydrogenase [Cytophagales bacterium CG12_big_fil_rev_8_21_14_0_65_40_12]|nr:MAG: short-chain dehydrogenase [Cytophagales bacterium CG12_big_fil_rev_8_21_14_0_65_40_12]PIW05195.1 MAG: short-chain dehydrogenase [Cytophagales bacterium CG17_big_fil_post_rev_8_21_14_2_50_40_13]
MKKLAVITGGTKGIGRATVEKFAEANFDIVTCARNQDQLDNLVFELKSKHPNVRIYAEKADLAQKDEVLAFAEVIKELNRPIAMLLNNTGVFFPGSIHSEEEGNLEMMIETNLYSAYYLTRALIGDMMKRKSGHIFTTGSIAGIQAYPNGGSYGISKFALLGFTKALREEMKPHGIRVTSILAGATYTSSWEGVDLPLDRFMKAEDIADAIFAAHALSPNTVVEEIILRPQLGDI